MINLTMVILLLIGWVLAMAIGFGALLWDEDL